MTIKINGDNTVANPGFSGDDTDTGLQVGTNELKLVTGGTARATVTSAGRVGIGTSSPDEMLHVAGASTVKLQLESNDTSNGASAIHFGDTDDVNVGRIQYQHNGDYMYFETNAAEHMRIDSSGNVGIGTQSPSSELQVNGDSDTQIRVVCSSGGSAGIQFGDTGDVVRGGVNFDATGNNLTLRGYNNTERMRIDSAGRVGIGTMSPKMDLQTGSSGGLEANNSGEIVLRYNMYFDGGDKYIQSSNKASSLVMNSSGDVLFYNTNTASTAADSAVSGLSERFRITSTGKIRALQVYSQTTTTGGAVYVQSDGDLLRFTSSLKYKTDVETIEDARADAILNCRPVWYRSTCESDITTEGSEKSDWGWYGFIAEEVAEVEPRLVNWATKDAIKQEDGSMESVQRDPADYTAEGVRYENFVPLLVNLVKRQQAAIETLETQNADLSARITALETA